MPTLRLDRIIAGTGLYSRNEAQALIKRGSVAVSGKPAQSGAERHDPEAEQITVDGDLLKFKKYRYIMLNKPQGYVSSTEDKREKTVMQLLDSKYSKLELFPVGRLDKDAEGLLLLTNDGRLAHEITSPSKEISKRYHVQIEGTVSASDIERFARGIELGDGTKCKPALLEPVPGGVAVTISEGKYHQVKRMMAAIGKQTKSLKRLAIGNLTLDESLAPGDYRELSEEIHTILGV